MSLKSNYFIIAGFDFSGMETEKYKSWRWSNEGQKYFDSQRPGEIQLFEDPESNRHLYFGYIFAAGDEYDFPTLKMNTADIEYVHLKVRQAAGELSRKGLIHIKENKRPANYQIIVFEEAR